MTERSAGLQGSGPRYRVGDLPAAPRDKKVPHP